MSEAEAEFPDELALAIRTAKTFVLKAFEGEPIENVGLEEVEPAGSTWKITLGFDRRRRAPFPYDAMPPPNPFLRAAAEAAARPQRIYKVMEVNASIPKVLSMSNRKDD